MSDVFDFQNWSVMNLLAALLGALIVVVGLVVFGWRDLARFSWTRVWAIATVCFQQSIRRRVLWITPLVIVGVILVSQFQRAVDAQDAIRQATMYSLFATGMLVMLVTIILACTNLPGEIETRVIYTVATKPTTRLEIVLGKVIGFVRVSFWILLIMGVFTWGYLNVLDWQLRRQIAAQLDAGAVEKASRPTFEFYRDHGTLHARQIAVPVGLGFFAHEPRPTKDDPDRWFAGGGSDSELHLGFVIDRSQLPTPPPSPRGQAAGPDGGAFMGPMPQQPRPGTSTGFEPGGVVIDIVLKAQRDPSYQRPQPATVPTTQATQSATQPATGPATQPATQPAERRSIPQVSFELRNRFRETVLAGEALGDVEPAFGRPELREEYGRIRHYLGPEQLDQLIARNAGPTLIYVTVTGDNPEYEYRLERALIYSADGPPPDSGRANPAEFAAREVHFAGRVGRYGQQLRGGPSAGNRVAVYEFHDVDLESGRGSYTCEMRVGTEQGYEEEGMDPDALTRVEVDVLNTRSGHRVSGIQVSPENNRPVFFEIPAEAVEGGHFNIIVRMKTPGWLGMVAGKNPSLKLVRGEQPFFWNLGKSLSVMWLMSLLVTIVSVFCSTFLSWPIAVVLTLVILTGRWGAIQLGEMSEGSTGRQFTDILGVKDPRATRALSETIDNMVYAMDAVTSVLPNLSKFAALEPMERGLAVPAQTLAASLLVSLAFGIPLLVLAYLFLKLKEVAP